jgi:hypothetical protein
MFLEDLIGELLPAANGRHVTRADFAVSILTLSSDHLKLFLKGIV